MKEKKEILLISHAYIKKINTSFCQILASHYQLNVSIIAPEKIGNKKIIYPDYKKIPFIENVYFLKTKFYHLRLMFYKKIFFILKKKKFQHIILDLDPVSFQSLILIFYSFFFKFKISYFSNENTILEKNKNIIQKLKFFFLKLTHAIIKRKVYLIFCYTTQIKNNLKKIGYKNKIVILPLGYNNKIFFKKKIFKSNKFIISYFGRIEPNKGIHTLIDALMKVNIKNFIFFLDTCHLDNLKYYETLKPKLKILQMKGQLKLIKPSYQSIANLMRMSNVTVVPSEWNEQYGRVLQEAAACGSLVIGSNVGAIPEIIFKRDFIFKPKNVSDLKNIIEKIYYNKKKYSNKFFPVYKHIINNRTILNQADILYSHLY